MGKLPIHLLFVSTIGLLFVASPMLAYAQQQMNFAATLTGKDMVPPVSTSATGTAKFHINNDGSVCYAVYANGISGVLGAHIGTKNGTELADLTNPYATTTGPGTIGAYPTASVHGLLTSGDIKAGVINKPGSFGVLSPIGLTGPLVGKNVTELDNILKNKTAYATVRTVDHERGEIQGQILPTSSSVSCLTTLRFAPPTTQPSPNSTTY
jgi:CHRD domain